jgi:hypothetical protein
MTGEVAGTTYIGGASVCPQSPDAVSFKQTRYYFMEIVICPSENGHLTYTLSPGGRVCYLRNASVRRE